MNLKSLHDIFGIKFQDTFYDIVVCEDPRNMYVDSKALLKSQANFTAKDTDLSIAITNPAGITTITKFVNVNKIENLRGMSIRCCYLEKDIKYKENVKSLIDQYIGRNIKNPIVEKD